MHTKHSASHPSPADSSEASPGLHSRCPEAPAKMYSSTSPALSASSWLLDNPSSRQSTPHPHCPTRLSDRQEYDRHQHSPFNAPHLPPLCAAHNALRDLFTAQCFDKMRGGLIATRHWHEKADDMDPWRTWGARVGESLQLLYSVSDRALELGTWSTGSAALTSSPLP